MSRGCTNAEEVLHLLYSSAYTLVLGLLPKHAEIIKKQVVFIIDRKHKMVEGKQRVHVEAAKSTEEVLKYLDIPDKWNDLLLLMLVLRAVQTCDLSCYEEAMKILDHYQGHLFQYLQIKNRLENIEAFQGAQKPLKQDQVEVNITLKDSIYQLKYSSCHELWFGVLAEGVGIPRDQIEIGGPVRPGSSIITFHIPKQYVKSLMKAHCQRAVSWVLLELRVQKIVIPGFIQVEINWSTAMFVIKDCLLSGGDFFRNTKVCIT